VQLDEKWSFVRKKEKHRRGGDGDGEGNAAKPAPAAAAAAAAAADDDAREGDSWDHVAVDPEHRLVLSTVPGKRTAERVGELVSDVKGRLGERVPRLVTSDEYAPYRQAVLDAWGVSVTPPRTGRPGRPRKARREPHPDLCYATVRKTRAKGRVVSVATAIVFGTVAAVMAALALSSCSAHVNTSFVERQNGTDRNRNARKARRTYCFSKDWDAHAAVGYFTLYSYNFCWPVRTLALRRDDGAGNVPRTPAMAAGLADHVWTLAEWLALPAIRHSA
jgi:IS1 family transposase